MPKIATVSKLWRQLCVIKTGFSVSVTLTAGNSRTGTGVLQSGRQPQGVGNAPVRRFESRGKGNRDTDVIPH